MKELMEVSAMEMKKSSIKRQIRRVVLITSIAAILLTSVFGIISMNSIKSMSESSLNEQMEVTVDSIVQGRASIADEKFNKYLDYIQTISDMITMMYEHPDKYLDNEVLPPSAEYEGILSMQRYFTSKDFNAQTEKEDLCLFGNLADYWKSVISEHSDVITNIYMATPQLMICCDGNANLAELDTDGESYYDYREMDWYKSVMESGKPHFTKSYLDSYGRGLMVSCGAPFYRDGRIAGVVSMDILISDLIESIISVDFGEGVYAFLVDDDGDIIASPYMDRNSDDFINIVSDKSEYTELAPILEQEKSCVIHATNGNYYAYSPIVSTNWNLIYSIPESFVQGPIDQMGTQIGYAILSFIVIFVIIVTLVIITGSRLARKITEPVIALEKDVEIISSGNLEHKAEVRANNELGDLASSVNKMAVSLDNYINDLTRMTAEKERIGAELDVATHIQSSMLPCIFPAFPDRKEFDVYASMTPAKEVGGDFYDFFMVDESHVAIVVADVSGKGVPAALFMVIGKTLIKDHTVSGAGLEKVFMEVNNLLCESNSENMFITAFEGVLDLKTGEFRYINAGHETPYICKKGDTFKQYPVKAGFVLAGMEDIVYRGGVCTLEPGDKLFQYTDGVPEATDANNELYGMERLDAVMTRVSNMTPEEILPVVKEDIDNFVKEAPQFDDITMLCLEYRERMKTE